MNATDAKNERADFVLGLAKAVRHRLGRMSIDQMRAQLVGEGRANEEEFFLALAAAELLEREEGEP